MSQQKPIQFAGEAEREDLAKIIARFIEVSKALNAGMSPEISAKAFDVATLLTSTYEGPNEWNAKFTRKEMVEFAVELLERAQKYVRKPGLPMADDDDPIPSAWSSSL